MFCEDSIGNCGVRGTTVEFCSTVRLLICDTAPLEHTAKVRINTGFHLGRAYTGQLISSHSSTWRVRCSNPFASLAVAPSNISKHGIRFANGPAKIRYGSRLPK